MEDTKKSAKVDPANGVVLTINIEDHLEFKTAMVTTLMLPREITVKEALRKIANKGNIYLIASNYSFGEDNFDLVYVDLMTSSERVLEKSAKLSECGLGPGQNTIILRKKKREEIKLTIEIADHQELACAKQISVRFYKDQMISEAVHKVTRKNAVWILDDKNFGLFSDTAFMDPVRSLESYGLKDNDKLILRKKKTEEVVLSIIIEDYKHLQCARKTSLMFKSNMTVFEVKQRAFAWIAQRGIVEDPKTEVEKYDLIVVHNSHVMGNDQKLSELNLQNRDSIILRKKESEVESAKLLGGVMTLTDLVFNEKIGQGTFGKVYRGFCLGNEVAIKVIKELPDTDQIREFKFETEMLKNSKCPQIVKFYGTVESPKMCIVMELCGRGSLYHVMNTPVYDFAWDRIFTVAIEMLKGMIYLHDRNIVHRDFKSLNVLVTDDWQIKLCDFGLARKSTDIDTLKKLRSTPAWSAPELLKETVFSFSSDVYGIGMVLWEMVNRCIKGKYQRPFAEFSNIVFDYQIIVQACNKNLRPTIPPNCPQSVVEMINASWDAVPENRPKCLEILQDLEKLKGQFILDPSSWPRE